MSEAWQIALFTAVSGGALGLLAWGAASLWGIHQDLRNFVLKSDCERDMDSHCQRIDDLSADVNNLTATVSGLEKAISIYHKEN